LEDHVAGLDVGPNGFEARFGTQVGKLLHGKDARPADIDGAEEGDERGQGFALFERYLRNPNPTTA
jgi:hypothetical protein